MPASISLQPRERIGTMRLSGVVDGAQLLDTVRDYFSSPAAIGGYGVLWDTRPVERFDASPEELQNVADLLDELYLRHGTTRWAVVGRDDAAVTLATLLLSSALGAPRELRLFDDSRSAATWLASTRPSRRRQRRLPSFVWSRLHRN